jgi:predicted acyl esterase
MVFETTAFNEQILRWLDHWLKGADTGIMEESEIAIYDNGTGTWRYENEYPLERTRWTRYYLHKSHLSSEPPAADSLPDSYPNISLNTARLASYGIVDEVLKTPKKPAYLVYVSSPLEKIPGIWGPISITLYAATSEYITSDWSFFIKLGEMYRKVFR